MFERPHHQFIEVVLTSLDSELLTMHACWFAGGTAIALRKAEYRESVSIDFLVADLQHYRALRQRLNGRSDMKPILRQGAPELRLTREWRADQYGIRSAVDLGPRPIKFEIVNEARIEFDTPGRSDKVCGISTLSLQDLSACKLLANADRWRDDSVFSRDVLDMAFLDLPPSRLAVPVIKATKAYGMGVVSDMRDACQRLVEREGWLARCMKTLSIQAPQAVVYKQLKRLDRRLQIVSSQLPASK